MGMVVAAVVMFVMVVPVHGPTRRGLGGILNSRRLIGTPRGKKAEDDRRHDARFD
jgi:hypothetical protein